MEDLTFRAVKVLSEVNLILAEDTRVTKKLLERYDISTQLSSFHAHNEHARLNGIIDQLKAGVDIALVSDAGMPGISDPGYLLIREAIREDIELDILPGPTAFVPALLHSGFPNHIFQFIGFLPQKKGRQTAIAELVEYPHTTILYESPHRIVKFLKQLCEEAPERWVSISRELTKMHQQTVRDSAQNLLQDFESKKYVIKGEFVVVVAPTDYVPSH